ncbi:hypothetical protein [Salinicoccus halodurans]|uniref:Ribosomal protein L7/L12 C-terminal domain-containing protein n=1 Tax=Salinicoccus halodurans TaxID=407035 RepID=A0A0F7D4F6_9STAP|nr:hypothetical protein [Salinicoccus halodurans]AKG74150.1 hypothetical protein AAT16_07815 [Salinicoccus halodurans]SFK61160.1 hypothetical protein SAMN05216235_0810 [Salinicoccus halodurans]
MGYTLLSVGLVMAFIILALYLKVNDLEKRIKTMKRTLDQLAKQSDMPENPINNELRKLIKEGKDIKAIKKAREALGLSLLEGKEYIDELKNNPTGN